MTAKSPGTCDKSSKVRLTPHQIYTIRALHQKSKWPVHKIIKHEQKLLKNVPKSTIYATAKVPLSEPVIDRRKHNPHAGRPSKFSTRDDSQIHRRIRQLQETVQDFTSDEIQHACGMQDQSSNITFRQHLHKLGYRCRANHRKGVLFARDKMLRVKFAKKVVREHGKGYEQLGFWRSQISMYTDIVGFEYKKNPYDHSRTPQARSWRLKNQGLKVTRKGKKEGMTLVKFLVGISHEIGVALVEKVPQGMIGEDYARIIRKGAFGRDRLILQDNCPVQNSKKAQTAFATKQIRLFSIPAKSPDLNIIENLFNQMKAKLRKGVIKNKITKESKDEFAERCFNELENFPIENIRKLVDSYPKRINQVIAGHGDRLKY